MTRLDPLSSRPCPRPDAAALAGTWKLPGKRALSLQPTQPGVLRVAHGSLWATVDGPHHGPLNDLGDLVLVAGDTLRIAAGERVVIESWCGDAASYFTWDPLAAPVRVPRARLAHALQPLADLRAAAMLGAHALARALAPLLRLGWETVRPPRPARVAADCCGA